MKESIEALLSAAFTVATCWGAGILLIERTGARLSRIEKHALAFVTGASLIHLFVFAMFAIHAAYKPVWLIAFAAVIALGARRSRFVAMVEAKSAPVPRAIRILFGAIFAVFSVWYLASAWAPETSADGSSYHLEMVVRYLRAHAFFPITSNMYAGLGQGIELLYAPAFAFGHHSAAALVHFAFLIALVAAIFAYGRRIGHPVAGGAAALLVYLSPVVARDGTTAYIDVAVAAIVFAVFYWLEIWDDAGHPAMLLLPVGLLAGYAYAAKYTAFVILPYAMLYILWRTRKIKPALAIAGIAAVMIVPWMAKDWIYFHDPVAPFANEIFPNPYLHPMTIWEWTQWLRRYDVAKLWTLPIVDTIDGGKTEGLLGPVFLLAPLGLLALRERAGRRLLVPGLLLLATYFGNVGTRFLIPCLPFFSLAIAIALARPVILLPALVVAHAVLSWPSVIPRYSNKYVWRIDNFPWRAALGIESHSDYLNRHLVHYGLIQAINDKVHANERVLSLSGLATSYLKPELLQSFQSAFSATLCDFLSVAQYPEWQPERSLNFKFPEKRVRRIRLLQTAQGQGLQQWNVHELRFFSAGKEIPRALVWRLRANPNPWDVQLAFDNSPVTRWRSWQTAAPGMFIEVDFGREETVDEVRMETSHDVEWPIRFRVESMEGNAWVALTDQFDEQRIQYRGSTRRAATIELAARGIHYLLVEDDDWGTADYRDDPEAWGLKVVAHTAGGTLYQVSP
jgi:hypothetical protein